MDSKDILIPERFIATRIGMRGTTGYLIDVGAYHGDFAMSVARAPEVDGAVLFECNPENVSYIRRKWRDEPDWYLVDKAVSSMSGQSSFHCGEDPSIGSLCEYVTRGSGINTMWVQTVTIDDWASKNRPGEKVAVLKIDAQGHDLEVLKGGRLLIAACRPIIMVELIWACLYEGQAAPVDIMEWMTEQDYQLAALFNDHYSPEGLLAFADGVFIPRDECQVHTSQFAPRVDHKTLLEEVETLRSVCEERLRVIHRIHREAEELRRWIDRKRQGSS